MTIPTLSPAQQFNASVNRASSSLAQVFATGGLQATYNSAYAAWFANANGTAAQAIAALGTTGAAQLAALQSIYTFLTAAGVTGLTAVPAFTANTDGSATLTA